MVGIMENANAMKMVKKMIFIGVSRDSGCLMTPEACSALPPHPSTSIRANSAPEIFAWVRVLNMDAPVVRTAAECKDPETETARGFRMCEQKAKRETPGGFRVALIVTIEGSNTMSDSAPPAYFNPWDPSFRANPYPHYGPLLAAPPRVMSFGPMPGAIIARYADVVTALRDHEHFSNVPPSSIPEPAYKGPFYP